MGGVVPDEGTAVGTTGSFTLTYTMSTWNLYNVALMQATFD